MRNVVQRMLACECLVGCAPPPRLLTRGELAFVRKEAVVSSQTESTHATLVDLLTFEAQGDATDKANAVAGWISFRAPASGSAPSVATPSICPLLEQDRGAFRDAPAVLTVFRTFVMLGPCQRLSTTMR
jgi:hypothetical protein